MGDAEGFRLLVVCPHFAPDTAPTGVVMTRLVDEMATLGHQIHVVTALPWYRDHRVADEWANVTWSDRETAMPWGSITRLNPFAGSDKRNIFRRALGFIGFTVTSALAGLLVARRKGCDAVLVMSPPLTLGIAAKIIAVTRRAPMILNIQDVFPDAAVATGVISNRLVIRIARVLERWTYRRSTSITVLSQDLHDNVCAKMSASFEDRVSVIPNFVDTSAVFPVSRKTAYRSELGIDDRIIVMYAGNVGFSQSLDLMIRAAPQFPDVAFVINGDGSERPRLEREAALVPNVVFGEFQPVERLAEVLCSADVHVVPLRAGLGRVSVPSKTYSILAAGRPIVASVDLGTEVPRLLELSGAGVTVPPDDLEAFVGALRTMLSDPDRITQMGQQGRAFVESAASPSAVAGLYSGLIRRSIDKNHRTR